MDYKNIHCFRKTTTEYMRAVKALLEICPNVRPVNNWRCPAPLEFEPSFGFDAKKLIPIATSISISWEGLFDWLRPKEARGDQGFGFIGWFKITPEVSIPFESYGMDHASTTTDEDGKTHRTPARRSSHTTQVKLRPWGHPPIQFRFYDWPKRRNEARELLELLPEAIRPNAIESWEKADNERKRWVKAMRDKADELAAMT